MSLRLSVIVCTHNRPLDLERCLEALVAQERPLEVIVVDSASEPPCQSLVESYSPRFAALRYVREEQAGLSRARNRGVAEATGRILAFLDDDAAPLPEWGGHIAAPFEADAEVGCVGGACVAVFEDDARRPRWLSDRLLQFAGITRFGPLVHEAARAPSGPLGRIWPSGRKRSSRRTNRSPTSSTPWGNDCFRAKTQRSSRRSWRAGWTIWLEPRAIVEHTVHAERCRSRYYWRRLWWAGVSRARATEASATLGLRLVVAAAVRLCLYVLTRDRVYLYRTAETAGFLTERARLLRSST
jgi:glycosyltransferase involved in cell wall biosynthesis